MVFEVCGGAVFYYFVILSFLMLDKCIFDFISVQLLGELNQLKETVSKGRKKEEMSSAHCALRDKRNSNSEKNQIRPCDHVWFPSVLAYVPEHVVLSMKLISLCYAIQKKVELN